MSENSNIKSKKKKSNRRKLILVLVLLALCIAAVIYIFAFSRANGRAGEEVQENTEITSETENTASESTSESAAEDAEGESNAATEHVYSHRGSQGEDELSFAAYDRAVEAGSKYIEADMVVSADGTIYVAHDDESKAMTGYDGYFSGMKDSQIDQLTTRAGNKVPKLTDLFEKYGDRVNYIIDIKYSSQRNITAFTETVKGSGLEDNIIAASFYSNALMPLEETFPDMPKLYLCGDQGAFNAALGFEYADILCVPASILTEDNLKAAHDNGKKFSVWTLNTEEEIKNAIETGVDSYFTDDTELAIKLEKENRH